MEVYNHNENKENNHPVAENNFELKIRTQTASSILPNRHKRSVTFAGTDRKFQIR